MTRWPLSLHVSISGMGVTPRHHGSVLGYARIGLPQPAPVFPRQTIEPPDCRVQQFGIGWKADDLWLHRGVDRDPLEVLAA